MSKTKPYSPAGPFEVRDCALAAIATGRSAQNLKELRDELRHVDSASVYFHFWGGLLRPAFDDPSYHNDFARWAHDALHNTALAERLSVIGPTDYDDLEELRWAVVDVMEDELDKSEAPVWTSRENRFLFIRSQIVIFDTGIVVEEPAGLPDAVSSMSRSSVFYHFIDARRRTPRGTDDFSTWLIDLHDEEHRELCNELAGIDPFYGTLSETKGCVEGVLERYLGNGGAR
ncbi:MAG: hypothetical protein GF400_01910 [Candidatus Eisenbacteria bacterium]|nr:hypothetical protein [Candidatus Eisenbacteria bacterium]